jgi:hypothetical protein
MTPEIWGVLAAIVTAIAAIVAAIIARKKGREELGAISAETFSELVDQIKALSIQRQEDCVKFEVDLEDMRVFYRDRLSEMEATQEAAMRKMNEKNTAEIEQVRVYYEGKIARLEQAHGDVVRSLKERIRRLENDSGIHR